MDFAIVSLRLAGLALTALPLCAGAALAIEGDDGSQTTFQIRYRYEYVSLDEDVTGFADPASTLNADIVLGYRTPVYEGLFGYFETETVANTFLDDYNSTGNGLVDYPVVADPEGSEINQSFISYKGDALPKTQIVVGRHRTLLRNFRHVGNVGWRLNEQTYDAATVVNNSVENLALLGSYVWNVNNTKGENLLLDLGLIFDATYKIADIGKLSGFGQLYDFVGDGDLLTYGLRLDGARKLNDSFKLIYEGEFAMQTATADNDSDFGANYFHVVLGGGFSDYYLKAGMESLGTDAGAGGFSFPTGTNHKFNGWADLFLGTPAVGLTDIYGVAGANFSAVEGLAAKVFFHDFAAIEGDAHFGTEIDGQITYQYDAHQTFGAKFALFSDDELGAGNVTKLWGWTTRSF